MRTGQDPQRAVGLIGIVEVEPHSEHLLEKFDGRLDVRNAILDTPRAEAGHLGTGAKCQCQILMV